MSNAELTNGPGENPARHADWPKMLDWIEKQAQDSLKARHATADNLAKEAQTTLSVLLAGIGASAAYGAKIFESGPPGPVATASAITCAYLIFVSAGLVLTCMRFKSYPALFQDPKNIMHPQHSLDSVREAEVKNLGQRISEASSKNETRARWLNCFRVMAVFSPLVFAAAAVVARH